jgi:tetratricopeptide (TPR) repeat protein
MSFPPSFPRTASSCLGWLLLALGAARAEVPPHLVLANGRAVPLASVALQGDGFVVKTPTADFAANAIIPAASVDHVFGDKPAEINQAVALLLLGRRDEALKLLETVLAKHKDTARLPGNFWMEAARAAVVAHAANGDAAPAGELAKAIAEVTPAQGADPISGLVRALTMSASVDFKERVSALRAQAGPELPADLSAYASFYRAELLLKRKLQAEALEAYLSVTCLYPSGGLVLNGVAQFKAAELLVAAGRRDEALTLVQAALRRLRGTAAEAEANKLLESIK